MPPNIARAMYSQDTPVPNKPSPNANPSQAAARGDAARRHSANRPASVRTGSAEKPKGANPRTVAAPSRSDATIGAIAGTESLAIAEALRRARGRIVFG